MWRASPVRLFLSFPIFAPICRVTDAKHKRHSLILIVKFSKQSNNTVYANANKRFWINRWATSLRTLRLKHVQGSTAKEALLGNVAAERVSLSKMSSGPHRSFHRAYRGIIMYPPRCFTFTM